MHSGGKVIFFFLQFVYVCVYICVCLNLCVGVPELAFQEVVRNHVDFG